MSDWGQGAKNNNVGWGQGASRNTVGWGDSHKKSWAGDTEIVGSDGNLPVNTVAPVISGTQLVGSTLTTTNGTWTSDTGVTGFTYQWRRNGVAISGATNNTYVLVNADLDTDITCAVAATDLDGTSAFVSSNALYIFDADYFAVLNYATTQGYTLPSVGQRSLQNKLLIDLKTAGVWAKLDAFAVFATNGDNNFALIDWKRLTQYTAVNSPTFITNQGFQGNGTSSYVDINYNPSVNAVNLSLNNNHIMAGNLRNNAQNSLLSSFGTNYLELSNDNAMSRIISFNMSLAGDTPLLGANNQNGIFISSRNNSSNYTLYKDAVSLGLPIRITVAIPNAQTRVFARSNSTFFGNALCPFLSIGSFLSGTEVTNYNNSLNTYINSL